MPLLLLLLLLFLLLLLLLLHFLFVVSSSTLPKFCSKKPYLQGHNASIFLIFVDVYCYCHCLLVVDCSLLVVDVCACTLLGCMMMQQLHTNTIFCQCLTSKILLALAVVSANP